MRIRTVKPEFWTHPVMTKQSDETKLLALALLNYADDEGFFYADEDMIRGALFPKKDSKMILGSIQELSRIGYIEVSKHPTHGPIGYIVKFNNHQRVDKPKTSNIKHLHNSKMILGSIQEGSTREQGMEQGTGNGMEHEPFVGETPTWGVDIKKGVPIIQKTSKYPPEVQSIWDAYPSKGRLRSSRKTVTTQWKAIKAHTDLETVLRAIKAWSKTDQWQKDGGQFVPALDRWLRDRRYEDLPDGYAAQLKRQATPNELKGL